MVGRARKIERRKSEQIISFESGRLLYELAKERAKVKFSATVVGKMYAVFALHGI